MIGIYMGLLKSQMQLAFRERIVIFFNYIFPLIFFFMFGELMDARKGTGAAQYLLSTVLSIGILGNGLFGIGMRAVQDRQQGILKRLHLAPISPAPVLFATLMSGLLVYLPSALMTVLLANWVYGMPIPSNMGSLFVFLSIASLAFRGLGLIIASVVNTMNEAQILIQILYFPMMFLSGTTFPLNVMPEWLRAVARFIPATYMTSGLQGILQNGESWIANLGSIAALLTTSIVGFLLSYQLFRWDKEDRVPGKAKAWVAVVIAPFLVLGVWESYRGTEAVRQAVNYREMMRNRNWMIRDVRVVVGDGAVIERANVFIRNGKIESVISEGGESAAAASTFSAVSGAGKTLMPGLIDVHTHLGGPGVVTGEMEQEFSDWSARALGAYLYCGVVAVKSVGDATDDLLKLRAKIRRGEMLAAELFMTGPLFTAPGGHGTEYFKNFPEMMRQRLEPQMAAAYANPSDAEARVNALAGQGIDGIKAVLESGGRGSLFERLDLNVFDAMVKAASQQHLPVVVHTGDLQDIRDAISRNVAGIEHGAMRDLISPEMAQEMSAKSIRYDPTLVVLDSFFKVARHDTSMLDDPLARQTISGKLLIKMRSWIQSLDSPQDMKNPPDILKLAAVENLRRLHEAKVPLVLGTDAGNAGTFHGPGVHREMEIWKNAGIPTVEILKAVTFNNAALLGAADRLGKIAPGYDASFIILDGNPIEDITVTRRISDVFFKGERVRRSELFRPSS